MNDAGILWNMSERRKLTGDEINNGLSAHPQWKIEEGKLCRSLNFMSFPDAFSFMTSIAFEAERMNHHPELSNVYSKVRIALVTHDLGGISSLDFELAARIDEAALRYRMR